MSLFRFVNKQLKKIEELINLKFYSEAIESLNHYLYKNKKDKKAFLLLAKVYFEKEELSRAKSILFKLVDLSPNATIVKEILEMVGTKKLADDNYLNANPCFSPDGKRVVFSSVRRDTNDNGKLDYNDNSGIYIVDIASGKEKQIVSDSYINTFPNFSPDGDKIVFLSRRYDTNKDGKIDYLDNPGVYIFDLNTNEQRCLVSEESYNKYPSFSPDGKKIIYTKWKGKNSGIFLYDLQTQKEEMIISDDYDNTFPSFSSDGRFIVYASWRRDTNYDGKINIYDNSGIFIYDVIKKREKEVIPDIFNNTFPKFSPDGRYIVFLSQRRDTNEDGKINSLDNPGVYIYDLLKEKEYCIVEDKYYNKFPTFSPNGKEIAYVSGGKISTGTNIRALFTQKGIYVIGINRKNKRQIISDKYRGNKYALFSPTEDKIVYLSWRKGTYRGLYIADTKKLPSLKELTQIIDENL